MRSIRMGIFALFAFGFLFAVLNPAAATADASSSVGVAVDSHVGAQPVAIGEDNDNAQASVVSDFVAAFPLWVKALSLLVTAFAGIAALTPTAKDDGVWRYARIVIDLLALNFLGAKNANDSKPDKYLR